MSNEDNKSESVNLENEQIEQRTLNSDEERKIKKSEETKADNFQKKSKARKNKSQNKFYKTKLPPISKSRKEQIYASQRENTASSVYSTSYSTVNIDPKDNDELYLEIHNSVKEIKNINRELKHLQKEYNILEESNITNKYIIEKILNMQDDNNDINNTENIEQLEEDKNNEKDEEKNKSKKKIKKLKLQSDESKKISALKKQINLYDNTLQLNNNKLEELKKKKNKFNINNWLIL